MASHKTLFLFFLSLLSLSSPSFSLNPRRSFSSSHGHPLLSFSFTTLSPIDLDPPSSSSSDDVHDLLPSYGFPVGLLPENVESYTLSIDGHFTVKLRSHCYVRFSDEVVFYDEKISGKLSFGSVKHVKGIEVKKDFTFLWVPVTAMESDPTSGTIIFSVGIFSEKLPAKLFDEIPSCRRKPNPEGSELVASV